MKHRRVVITGLSAIAPNGIGKDAFWKGLKEGQNAVTRITRFDTSRFSTKIGGEIKDFKPHLKIPKEHIAHMDRAYQIGVTAALMAVEDSGLNPAAVDVSRWGVYMGIAVAGVDGFENDFCRWRKEGISGVQANWYQGWFPSACSGYISLILGLRGNSQVLSTGCCSSVDAMGMALDAIRSGREDIALAGGAEAPLTPLGLNAFCSMRALSTRNDDPAHASRPFDKDRDGFVLAEGGAVVVLESLEHAQARGATIYAELKGYGTTSNAYHMTAPDPSAEQTARAFRLALEDADIASNTVHAILTHGSSTPLNEKAETLAVKKAFGSHAWSVKIPSIKSMIGHSLGSAGLLQVTAGALSLKNQIVPPTTNYQTPDPECDLDCVPNYSRPMKLDVVMTNTAGFSGKNTATVLAAF